MRIVPLLPTIVTIMFLTGQTYGAMVPPVMPIVEDFSAEKYEQQDIRDGRLREHRLSQVLVIPNSEWIAFVIAANFRSADVPDSEAVGCYHIATGKRRQLSFSLLLPRSQRPIDLTIIPFANNCCGIVTTIGCSDTTTVKRRSSSASAKAVLERNADNETHGLHSRPLLWSWDLETSEVRFIGPWHSALSDATRFLNFKRCAIGWTSVSQDRLSGDLEVCNRSANAGTKVSIHLDRVTCAPTSSPCAFAVCDAYNVHKGRLKVYCVDPDTPNGVRWTLTKQEVEAIVGTGVVRAEFVQRSGLSRGALPLLVTTSPTRERIENYMLLLDEHSGRARSCRLPYDELLPSPLISPNCRRLVFVDEGIALGGKSPATAEEVIAGEDYLRCRIIELPSGPSRSTENLHDRLLSCSLHGFLDNQRLLLSDEHGIWILDIGHDLRLRELFRLNGAIMGRIAPRDPG